MALGSVPGAGAAAEVMEAEWTENGGNSADPWALWRRGRGLLLLHGLLDEAPLRELSHLLRALAAAEAGGGEPMGGGDPGGDVAAAYGALFRALLDQGMTLGGGLASPAGDSLRTGIAHALVLHESAFSRAAEGATGGTASGLDLPSPVKQVQKGRPGKRLDARGLAPALRAAAVADLRVLQELACLGPWLLPAVAAATGEAVPPPWPRLEAAPAAVSGPARGRAPVMHLSHSGAAAEPSGDAVAALVARLVAAPDWGALVDDLAAHYAAHGSGEFARYRAFRWEGRLLPVPVPDTVRGADLIGYQAERALLYRTTAQFLAGYPANNVLLYGDRGTGKSSSIKALLNEHSDGAGAGGGASGDARHVDWDRLRLVEVPKSRLHDFPALVALLRGRPQRFILFVDDLSYEEGETQYKDLKAVLEGGLEARPENVVVYATSNRRHLIREQFADRAAPDSDEVHARDTVQEKLSFSDRFGVTITFPSPDQAAYLAIVEGLARQRGLDVGPAALRARAIEWAAWHNGRSGRTARQFVDYLAGELGLAGIHGGDGGEGHGGEDSPGRPRG